MMILLGTFHALTGLAAILDDKFYVVSKNYVFEFDVTTWGWIQLILGVVVVAAGIFLLSGTMWARIVAIALAVLSGVANFVSIPYYPVWSIVTLAASVAVVWTLTVHGREIGME
jgi:hypothetical protein